MVVGELEVRGTALDVLAAVRPLSLSDYPHKSYYWIDPPYSNNEKTEKKSPFIAIKIKRKDEKLQELLGTPVEIKRRKTASVEKLPFELISQPFPSYKILADIYKSQRKTLEDMKESLFGPYKYDKNQDDLFDLSILYPYMSNAYKKLYGQHLDNLKEISKNFKNLQPSKKTVKIQETGDSQESDEN